MSVRTREKAREIVRWGIVGLPLSAVVVATFLPLRAIYQQALIGFVLIWFQFTLMLGIFNLE
jgi:hypothetical protein